MFLLRTVFLTVDLERKTGITGVPFGRTELSLRLSWIEFGALAPRGVPRALGFKECPKSRFFSWFSGGHFSKKKWKNFFLRFFFWGDGLGPGGARAQAPGPRGPGPRAQRASRAQSIAELYIFSCFCFCFYNCSTVLFEKNVWKWLTNMVGFWNLGLRMIPNDRPR